MRGVIAVEATAPADCVSAEWGREKAGDAYSRPLSLPAVALVPS